MSQVAVDDTIADAQPAPARDPIRVFVVANKGYYADGLVSIVSNSAANQVVACAEPGKSCLDLFRATPADVLLIHNRVITAPMSTVFARFRQAAPDIRILVFGQDMEPAYLYELVRSGAHGYINGDMTADDLLTALRDLKAGHLWVERSVLEQFAYHAVAIEDMIEELLKQKIAAFGDVLTRRETEVFQLVLQGLSTKEIADAIHLSQQSVKLHLGRIFKKFDCTNRSQLIVIAFSRVCPVSNMVRLFRAGLDKRRLHHGQAPAITDPLA